MQRNREKKNRIGKTRAIFKKIRDTMGTCHAKIVSIKDKNGMDLTEAEDFKKRWQQYTEVKLSCSVVFNSLQPHGL